MKTKTNILKNTIIFIVVFIIVSLLFIISLGLVFSQNNVENYVSKYFPTSETVDDRTIDWDEIGAYGGSGLVIDGGKVIRSYNKTYKDQYSEKEILDMLTVNEGSSTRMVYNTADGKKLLLEYDNEAVKYIWQVDINQEKAPLKTEIIAAIIFIILAYLGILYMIVRWLSRRINKEIAGIYRKEEEEKDILFRGIAHDVKTPLSVIISYSKALNDEIVETDKKDSYLKSIEKNANILNDRIDDLLEFASLGPSNIQKENKDILEIIRRYVGDNYMYFLDNGGEIEILFDEEESLFTLVDEKLFKRLLQNILQNSIDHNKESVKIYIDCKHNKLIFKDSGKGISKDMVEKIFNPLFTGEESRTGDKLRGMGLSNVKRICHMHGWKIYYDKGFVIDMKKELLQNR